MTAQAYKIGGTMKPELKFGRWVITEKGEGAVYIQKHLGGGHSVMIGDKYVHRDHVEPDLNAPPMNGDEVIGECIGSTGSHASGQYVGLDSDGRHVISNRNIGLVPCISVRHPQPSKREELEKLLDRYSCYKSFDTKCLADQIDKIYTEDL